MPSKPIATLLVLLMLAGSGWVAASDSRTAALALQRKAADSFVQLRETFRRTFELGPLRQDLATADAELAQSTEALQREDLHAEVATGLIWRAQLARMREDFDQAAQLYASAASAALRAGDAAQQATAWAGKAWVEMAHKQPHLAADDARRAIALAQSSTSFDALSSAYGVLTAVHTERREIDAATQASRQEFAAAGQARDPANLFFAHWQRATLRMLDVLQCDLLGDIVPCLEAIDAVTADLDAAVSTATRLGYTAMANSVSRQRAELSRVRSRIEKRE